MRAPRRSSQPQRQYRPTKLPLSVMEFLFNTVWFSQFRQPGSPKQSSYPCHVFVPGTGLKCTVTGRMGISRFTKVCFLHAGPPSRAG